MGSSSFPGFLILSLSAGEGSICFAASSATLDTVLAVSAKTWRPIVFRSERKILKSELVSSRLPTVLMLSYATGHEQKVIQIE